jgi:NADPH-dependent glutamate synthase beta subunit-like oxidoreductase
MTKVLLGVMLLCSAAPLAAEHDFLSASEVDQVRLAQEPNERLVLYLSFARQRLDQLKQFLHETKPGRSVMIHDLLDEYGKIIDAIDAVSEDALARKVDIAVGTKAVASAEKEFLPVLQKIRDSQPKDLDRYEFVLTQAIDTTRDSLDDASEDLGKRSSEVVARENKEKKEREEMMSPADLEAKRAAEAKAAEAKRKKPTLLRPGETIQQHK